MNLFIIRVLLHYETPLVTVARGDDGALFVGVVYGVDDQLFVGVCGSMLDALLFGEIDLLGLMQSPEVGPLFHHRGEVAIGDTVAGERVGRIPADALPQSGLLLHALTPAQGV